MVKRMTRETLAVALCGAILAIIGALGLWVGQPWLIPSLGPSLYHHTLTPNQPNARALNTFLGHTLGLVFTLVAVYLTAAHTAPSVIGAEMLTWPRIAASVLAVVALFAVQLAIRLPHPPAATTALLVALGAIDPTWDGALTIFVAIVLLTLLGEGARRIQLKLGPTPC
jgi:hypothetical protein